MPLPQPLLQLRRPDLVRGRTIVGDVIVGNRPSVFTGHQHGAVHPGDKPRNVPDFRSGADDPLGNVKGERDFVA